MTDPDAGSGDTETDDPEYDVNFRENPEEYEVGRGEQGAFKVQPYKSELLPNWTIKTLDAGEESAETIFEQFQQYKRDGDFVGMDMARKYLQMGYTRAMRYAKYPGGQKYEDNEAHRASNGSGETANREEREPQEWYDEEKREIALRFETKWEQVREDDKYQRLRDEHREKHG
ncbi:DUF4385 domain-containing protein [Halorussus lipolyticus]|uniref:DUF4385 domain-containing protein n=1 Tax=Halorussus lipolyticus TaxID=3034024 RepID=UPI0023E771C0|nr:DUF4385 domain-containing protein [Halorussus sp. DT80]